MKKKKSELEGVVKSGGSEKRSPHFNPPLYFIYSAVEYAYCIYIYIYISQIDLGC